MLFAILFVFIHAIRDEARSAAARKRTAERTRSSSEQSRGELWLSKRLIQDKCQSHAGLAELQRHIVNCLGHIVVRKSVAAPCVGFG
jgi:hypothetical protein